MHEVGIMQGALATAEQQARERGATRIHRLSLRIGQLSGVVSDSLQFAFEALSIGTLAEGGVLEITPVPAAFWCRRCEREFECPDFYLNVRNVINGMANCAGAGKWNLARWRYPRYVQRLRLRTGWSSAGGWTACQPPRRPRTSCA